MNTILETSDTILSQRRKVAKVFNLSLFLGLRDLSLGGFAKDKFGILQKTLFIFLFTLVITSIGLAKEPQWKKFDEGLKQAKLSGKKVLVDVYTDWCGWCKKMDTVTYTDKKVSDYLAKNFVIVKLNAEGNESMTYSGEKITPAQFAQGMGVTGYPATLFLQSNGQPITLLPGYSEADMFIHVLSFIAEDHYQKKKFQDYLAEKGVKK